VLHWRFLEGAMEVTAGRVVLLRRNFESAAASGTEGLLQMRWSLKAYITITVLSI